MFENIYICTFFGRENFWGLGQTSKRANQQELGDDTAHSHSNPPSLPPGKVWPLNAQKWQIQKMFCDNIPKMPPKMPILAILRPSNLPEGPRPNRRSSPGRSASSGSKAPKRSRKIAIYRSGPISKNRPKPQNRQKMADLEVQKRSAAAARRLGGKLRVSRLRQGKTLLEPSPPFFRLLVYPSPPKFFQFFLRNKIVFCAKTKISRFSQLLTRAAAQRRGGSTAPSDSRSRAAVVPFARLPQPT